MENEILVSLPPTNLNKRNKKGSMAAVKRWIMRGTSTTTPTPPSPPPVVVQAKYQRGRSQSLDVQSLERSGVRTLLMNVGLFLNFYFLKLLHYIKTFRIN